MTKRVHRGPDNKYHIGNKAYKHLVGSRRQVFEGFAYKTTGNLCKADLIRNKHGRYVSRSKHASAVAERRLNKYGYTAVKGKFGAVRMSAVQKTARAARRRIKRRVNGGGGDGGDKVTTDGEGNNNGEGNTDEQ